MLFRSAPLTSPLLFCAVNRARASHRSSPPLGSSPFVPCRRLELPPQAPAPAPRSPSRAAPSRGFPRTQDPLEHRDASPAAAQATVSSLSGDHATAVRSTPHLPSDPDRKAPNRSTYRIGTGHLGTAKSALPVRTNQNLPPGPVLVKPESICYLNPI